MKKKNVCIRYYHNLTRQFHVQAEGALERAAILNATAHWYAHNAMIHFSMPHDLEQPGGAAWGTRDICQGPFEFFLTTGHYALLREILLNIFSHQSLTTREWAQWFMFDRYHMDSGECHGDVIFWPLKCVADYINACGDTSILSEELPYDGPTAEKATLTEHLKCPDGVRLMDKPANYDGGVSTLFKRAEQAANVGREICLQYTHIRYLESMAKSENGEEAWNSLFAVKSDPDPEICPECPHPPADRQCTRHPFL